jgi:hypothetical protein
VDGLLKSFETVQLARINQEDLPHGCTVLLKRDNSAAREASPTPPQTGTNCTSQPSNLRVPFATLAILSGRALGMAERTRHGFAAWSKTCVQKKEMLTQRPPLPECQKNGARQCV